MRAARRPVYLTSAGNQFLGECLFLTTLHHKVTELNTLYNLKSSKCPVFRKRNGQLQYKYLNFIITCSKNIFFFNNSITKRPKR